ncbi:MAG: hypothetical protein JXI33_03905 [Candidatus Aminicenantes bacterium]|nr:hypothetical protein [Candidatus Aminicenantes bacterium]
MNANLKVKFENLFARYFPGAELPLTFYYADNPPPGLKVSPPSRGNGLFGFLTVLPRAETFSTKRKY